MSRRNDSLCERFLEDGTRYYTIPRPTAQEGIGRALRTVYRKPTNDALPPEMIDLLNRLDQAGL
jgi:hypothetical protein